MLCSVASGVYRDYVRMCLGVEGQGTRGGQGQGGFSFNVWFDKYVNKTQLNKNKKGKNMLQHFISTIIVGRPRRVFTICVISEAFFKFFTEFENEVLKL